MATHFLGDTAVLTGRTMRHVTRSFDTIITTAITPIAMSLIGNPPVIFLDEPTAGLDPQARIEVWQAVKELAKGGTTVLLTTQYLEEAEQLAGRIAILHQGRIIVDGTLAELKQLLPPAKVEYVEKQPSLEDVFLALVGDTGQTQKESR